MGKLLWLPAVWLWLYCACLEVTSAAPPNIIFALGDDCGWCDFQHKDADIATPTISGLANRGVVLNQSYTLQVCSPARTAILAGRYPHRVGMQNIRIHHKNLQYLDPSVTLLPQKLKTLGYKTHLIGKWHLGNCDWKLTPTKRGFDTFYGFYGAETGYFNHSGQGEGTYDFRDNERVAWEAKGLYTTELMTTRAQQTIRTRGNAPFFMFVAYPNAHIPFEVKQRYIDDYCTHVVDEKRRIKCGMMAAMDESIRNITQTLDSEGITEDTIIIFACDNGGPVGDVGSYNWPLRGRKSTMYEGGTRTWTAFVYPRKIAGGKTWNSLFHASDWFPTLLSAAGGDAQAAIAELKLNGVNQYYNIINDKPGFRKDMVYNIQDNTAARAAAVRIGDLKLIRGEVSENGWSSPPSFGGIDEAGPAGETAWQLYNVRNDPEERHNLITDPAYAKNITQLKNFLAMEENLLVPSLLPTPTEPLGSSLNYGGVWSPGYCCV